MFTLTNIKHPTLPPAIPNPDSSTLRFLSFHRLFLQILTYESFCACFPPFLPLKQLSIQHPSRPPFPSAGLLTHVFLLT